MLVNRALSTLLTIVLLGISAWAQQPAQRPASPAGPASPTASSEEVARITIQELKAKMDKKEKVIVVDVRRGPATVIKGAKNIPYDEIEKHLSELPKDTLIVTVCA
jgi:hypothetical protein